MSAENWRVSAGLRYALVSESLKLGKKMILTGRNLKRLARVLGVSVDYLAWNVQGQDEQGDCEPAGIAGMVGA